MRNRKGFTLMELLLVVAVLAIVAAAAAPTFFGGATEAMNEAKKAAFLSAYQNALSAASIAVSLESSKGTMPTDGTIIDLGKYAPIAARQFKNANDSFYTLGAIFIDAETGVQVVYAEGTEEPSATDTIIDKTTQADLAKVWNNINGVAE